MSNFPQNANGSATSANSAPVVIASDQATVPVSLASVPSHAVTNAGTFATQATLAAETTKVIGVTRTADGAGNLLTSTTNALDVNIKSGNPTSITANAGTNLNTSALALDATVGTTNTEIGGLTETAPATDTASSGLNGRLQRLAQRLTTLLAVFPATIDTNSGTKSASTLRVVLATDQPALTNKLLVTPDSVALPANQSVNVSQINAITPLMGNGVTGTGSQRVTIASDNTAFSVNAAATLAAETTKVIGTVRNSDGAGNLWTSNSTTYTAKFGQDSNLLGTLGTAFSTAGKVDVKAADGDVFVRQATGSNLHIVVDSGTVTTVSTVTNLSQLGGTAVAMNTGTRSAGTQRVTIATDDVVPASQSGTWTVQPGNTANTTPWLTSQTPLTSGGLSVYHLASAATTNLQVPKASAGQLYGYMVSNTSAAYSYLCFHNSASTPTAGASIFFKIGIPAGGAANVNFDSGIAFSTGIAISTVTGAADNNTTAVALNDLIINLFYK